jgi:polysaccharide biosynthesis transport protein
MRGVGQKPWTVTVKIAASTWQENHLLAPQVPQISSPDPSVCPVSHRDGSSLLPHTGGMPACRSPGKGEIHKRELSDRWGSSKASDMNDYLGTLSRYKALILLVAAVMAGAAYRITSKQPAQYQATSKLLVNQNPVAALPSTTPSVSDPTALERLTSTQIHLAQTPAVASAALKAVGVKHMTAGELLGHVSVAEEPNSDLVDVSVTAGTPSLAERLSAAFANAFAGYQADLAGVALARERAGVQAAINSDLRANKGDQAAVTNSQSLTNGPSLANGQSFTNSQSFQQLLSLRDDLAAASASAPRSSVVASAAPTATKVAPMPLRNSALALVLGLLLGSGLAFLIDARDRRARTTEEIGERLGLNLLAHIPAPPRRWRSRADSAVTMLSDPASFQAEAIKMLQANLELARLHGPAQVVLFTSAIEQEGKSTTVANLAVSLAQAGGDVVVVDADLREPTLARLFDVLDEPGMAEVARGEVEPDQVRDLLRDVELDAAATPSSVRGMLRILPAGRHEEQPDRLLSSPAVPLLFAELRMDAEWVLVDTPAMTKFYDSFIISQHVDALVAVARVWFVQLPTLAEFGRLLAAAPVSPLGYVATGVRRKNAARHDDLPRIERGAILRPVEVAPADPQR